MNEIEDAVASGIHSGNQVRPRHRALRRNARRKLAERSLLHELGKIRHFAFLDESLQQMRIHAIDAEDDHLIVTVPATGPLTGQHGHSASQQQQREHK